MRSWPTWLQLRLDALSGDELIRCKSWLDSLPPGIELQETLSISGLGSHPNVLQRDLVTVRSHLESLKVQQTQEPNLRKSSLFTGDIGRERAIGAEKARIKAEIRDCERREEELI